MNSRDYPLMNSFLIDIGIKFTGIASSFAQWTDSFVLSRFSRPNVPKDTGTLRVRSAPCKRGNSAFLTISDALSRNFLPFFLRRLTFLFLRFTKRVELTLSAKTERENQWSIPLPRRRSIAHLSSEIGNGTSQSSAGLRPNQDSL